MAYTPREIKDRVAVGDDIFIVEDLGGNRIRLIPAPTHVSEAGTPVNKALLQPIEDYLATGVVPVERTILPGDGLSGGGSLNRDRILSLGTPSTLSGATSNSVTATSHTHAISVATQAEAEAGTDNVKLMTPQRTKQAIAALQAVKSVAGKTGAVTLTKSDVGLGSVQNYGIATQAQAQAGTANNVYMTPLRVKEAMRNAFAVVGEGSITLEEGDVGVQILLDIPRGTKLTCFINSTDDVHYTFRDLATQNCRLTFWTVNREPSPRDIFINYTVVAWNMPA